MLWQTERRYVVFLRGLTCSFLLHAALSLITNTIKVWTSGKLSRQLINTILKVDWYWHFLDLKLRAILGPTLSHFSFFFGLYYYFFSNFSWCTADVWLWCTVKPGYPSQIFLEFLHQHIFLLLLEKVKVSIIAILI